MKTAPTRRSRLAATTIALSLLGVLLTACTAGGHMGAQSGDGGSVAIPAVPDDGSVIEPGQIPEEDRQIVSSGQLRLESADPLTTARDAADIVIEAGGRIDNRTETPTSEHAPASANLVARIPADDLDSVLDGLGALATVRSTSINQTDVTTTAADIDARITALQRSVDRLLDLMTEATTTADLIEIESSLAQRQAELDGLVAQRDLLTDQVAFATVGISVTAPGEVAGAPPGDFLAGIVVGVQALGTFFGGVLVVLGIMLPWLLLAGAIVALVVVLIRIVRTRRSRERNDTAQRRAAERSSSAVPERRRSPAADVIPPRPPLPTSPDDDPSR